MKNTTTEIYLDSRTEAQWSTVTKIIPKGFVVLGDVS